MPMVTTMANVGNALHVMRNLNHATEMENRNMEGSLSDDLLTGRTPVPAIARGDDCSK